MAWYVVRCVSRQERRVVQELEDLGLVAYCPFEIRWAKHAKRKASVSRALFPGYVFAVLPDGQSVYQAESIRLVRDIMRSESGSLLQASAASIRGLFLAEIFHTFDETWEPPKVKGRRYSHRWKRGERVTISRGPFEGYAGEIARTRGARRVELLISVFGRTQEVVVETSHLAPDQQDVAPKLAA